jgi:cyclopropane-fatty-acyl-phospholipid synthase
MSSSSIDRSRGVTFGLPAFDRVARRIMLGAARRIQVGRLTIVLPDGSHEVVGASDGSGPRAEIRIHDERAVMRMFLGGETGAGEAWMDGSWSSPDLPALLKLAARNRDALALSRGWWRLPLQIPRIVGHRLRRNTMSQASRNIRRHYDLGNDFYRLFLDETMTYSSALYESPDQSLADAQRAKYRVIAERAGIQKGMHVLEIGSGWGGFALYAAGELGARVTSLTISPAQQALARERIRAARLEELATVELRDYRAIEGQFDAVVSIEMIEAVGHEYLPTYFAACDRALKPGGRMSLQSITFHDADYDAQRRSANWIQTYIFPGGLLPSLAQIERATAGTRLLVTGAQDVASSYARTLATWRSNFLGRLDEVRAQGFDERFIRMWEYYLAISEAGFATGITQVQQIVLEKRRGLA